MGTNTEGIIDLYIQHAAEHVLSHVNSNTPDNVSRVKCELEILSGLDQASFPIEYKMAYYNEILHTETFTTFWLGQKFQHSLSASSIARFIPDPTLCKPPPIPDTPTTSTWNPTAHRPLIRARRARIRAHTRSLRLPATPTAAAARSSSPIPQSSSPSGRITMHGGFSEEENNDNGVEVEKEWNEADAEADAEAEAEAAVVKREERGRKMERERKGGKGKGMPGKWIAGKWRIGG